MGCLAWTLGEHETKASYTLDNPIIEDVPKSRVRQRKSCKRFRPVDLPKFEEVSEGGLAATR